MSDELSWIGAGLQHGFKLAEAEYESMKPSLAVEVTRHNIKRGGLYNWRHGDRRPLKYMGEMRDASGYWHQFETTDNPDVVWCEVRDSELVMFEVTKK